MRNITKISFMVGNTLMFLMAIYIVLMWVVPQEEIIQTRVNTIIQEQKVDCQQEIRNWLNKS